MEQNVITSHQEKSSGEIILYQPNDSISIEVRINQDTVWLNRQQLAMLFDRDVKTIGKHINNALKEELSDVATIAKFATVQVEGTRIVNKTKRPLCSDFPQNLYICHRTIYIDL